MFKNDTILVLNKNVLKRFEPNLEDGTLFLFNVQTEKYWSGNAAVDCLIRMLDGQNTLQTIYDYLFEIFENYTKEEICESFDNIIKILLEEGFLVIKNDI